MSGSVQNQNYSPFAKQRVSSAISKDNYGPGEVVNSSPSLSYDVTVIGASPGFGHPHSHIYIPSVLGIPGGGCPKR